MGRRSISDRPAKRAIRRRPNRELRGLVATADAKRQTAVDEFPPLAGTTRYRPSHRYPSSLLRFGFLLRTGKRWRVGVGYLAKQKDGEAGENQYGVEP